MRRYIANRLLQMVPVMFIISLIVFVLVRIVPNDPIYVLVGRDSEGISREQYEVMRHELGLDRPLPVQYLSWIKGIFTGDWGNSFRSRRPVLEEFRLRLPYTLQLAVAALLVSTFIGVTTGIIAALKRNSLLDMAATSFAMFGVAVPNFWLALMLILLFGVFVQWLPTHGSALIYKEPVAGIRHLILPTLALGLAGSATIMRQTRSALLEVLREDYVRTARAKGLAEQRVILVHALRNSLLPVVTILGLRLGDIFAGSVIIETMFSWPGVGRLAVNALQVSDFPVVQVVVILVSMSVLFANLLTDILYGILDPRIRYG